MIKVEISALAIDANSNTPIMLLKDEAGDRVLPIWIGYAEASAIAMAQSFPRHEIERPLTHDLLKLILDGLNASLVKVVIDELDGTTYKAKIFVQNGTTDCVLDARPSDGVALALRTGAPIFIAEAVFDPEIAPVTMHGESVEELRKRLRDIDPSHFGKFNF